MINTRFMCEDEARAKYNREVVCKMKLEPWWSEKQVPDSSWMASHSGGKRLNKPVPTSRDDDIDNP